METHKSIVEKIREAYERAGGAAKNWAAQIAKGTTTQAIANLQSLERELQNIRDTARAPVDAFGRDKIGTVSQLSEAVKRFKEGATSALEFKASVDQIAQADPKLDRGIALALLGIADSAQKAEEQVKAAHAAIRALNGVANEADLKTLGLSRPTASPSEDDDAAKARKNFEQRLLQSRQAVELARQDLALQNASTLTQERARAAMEVRHQMEDEALKLYGDRNAYDKKHYEALVAEATKLAEINDQIRRVQLTSELTFANAQLGRNELERAVYERMQSAGLLQNGQIVGAQNQQIAGQIRLNEQMTRSIDIQKDFASSFVDGMRQGKSAIDALTDSLNRLLDKLLDSQFDVLFSSLQKGGMLPNLFDMFGSGSGSGWATTILPSAKGNVLSGGNVIPFARGGIVNRPTMFPMAKSTGLMGEAGPEAIIPLRRGPGGRLGIEGGGSTKVEVNIVNNSGSEVSQTRRQTSDGEIIDIVIGAVNSGFSGGKFDKSMGGRYGARVTPRQR